MIIWECVKKPFTAHQATYNIIIALATAFTLVWGVITFNLLQQKEKAEADLNEIRTRIRNSESTTVKISSTTFEDDEGYYIYPVVIIKNNGKEKMVLSLETNSLTVNKIYLEGDKAIAEYTYHPPFFEIISDNEKKDSKQFTMVVVPVDGERMLTYALKVKEKGTYFISFSAGAYLNKDKTTIDNHQLIWFASQYVNIK
ncbi:hypothetical protein [Dickeya fangzhongdai]|uniref:hypothetical protein n=1 Tax=Dickeya fangzhongdai TaxID=1778540 RepID=UPI0023E3D3AC|nr:hypothetical protein [Dickeya fangzhongdai]WES88939.1 hypothetical protein PQ617_22520 [Dickeya fangzhongdai]